MNERIEPLFQLFMPLHLLPMSLAGKSKNDNDLFGSFHSNVLCTQLCMRLVVLYNKAGIVPPIKKLMTVLLNGWLLIESFCFYRQYALQ